MKPLVEPLRSLRSKIILLTFFSVLISALAIGALSYLRLESIVLETATEKLAGQTRLMAQRFKISYDQMKSDVQVLSQTPPISGIIRSQENFGVDPNDGSSVENWNQRLGKIFSSVLSIRSHYTQIRYIGRANNWKELVRANRVDGGISAVPAALLQEKGGEDYVARSLDNASSDILFSDITYNREQGRVRAGDTPHVRVLQRVFAPDGDLFGLVVINSDYGEMLRAAFNELDPPENTIVFNNSGDYMQYDKHNRNNKLQLHGSYASPPPAVLTSILSDSNGESHFTKDDKIYYAVKLPIGANEDGGYIGVLLQSSRDALLRSTYQVRTLSTISGIALVLSCLLISVVISRRFTQPLKSMTDAIKHGGNGMDWAKLPLQRNDEIGDLARAFSQKARKLADSEEKVQSIIDNVMDGIITIDAKGVITSFNPASERIFGYSTEEVLGRNLKMLMPERYSTAHDGYLSSYQRIGGGAVIGTAREFSGMRKNGEVFPVEISISELRLDHEIRFNGIVRDISERKQMEHLKDEFISTVNHEIRTPLTSIQASVGLIRSKIDDSLDKKVYRLLDIAHDNCVRLRNLVNDILDIEKMAAGKMVYDFGCVEIGALVSEVVDGQVPLETEYEVKFVKVGNWPQSFAHVDENRINQALVNLLSNAAKFSPRKADVEVSVVETAIGGIEISVRDHGPGVPDSFRHKLFERFAQADGSATRSQGGTGLGLSITKSIIEAHGGDITYATHTDGGAIFTICLKAVEVLEGAA